MYKRQLVASSVPGEGKTTVAINLAIALAQQGKACILDADLRRSSVAKAFHLDGLAGLGDYLAAGASLESVLAPVPGVPSLTLIASGSPVKDPGKLVNSEQMRELLRILRDRFDFLVVDSPVRGIGAHVRHVVVSSALLDELEDEELAALLCHADHHRQAGDGIRRAFLVACGWPVLLLSLIHI